MTEEEYFRKNYPDSCYGDKPLSPHWDFFQDGVEFGERQSEKRIAELERKLEQTEKDLADYQFNYPTIKELQKENAELKAVNRMALYSKMSDQLAKAKEILADIIKFQPYINRDTMFLTVGNDWKEVIYKAEQFLNEDSTYERIQKAKYNYAD